MRTLWSRCSFRMHFASGAITAARAANMVAIRGKSCDSVNYIPTQIGCAVIRHTKENRVFPVPVEMNRSYRFIRDIPVPYPAGCPNGALANKVRIIIGAAPCVVAGAAFMRMHTPSMQVMVTMSKNAGSGMLVQTWANPAPGADRDRVRFVDTETREAIEVPLGSLTYMASLVQKRALYPVFHRTRNRVIMYVEEHVTPWLEKYFSRTEHVTLLKAIAA